ncbi:MAG: RNA polymerase sigma factor [Bryobacteraceae bacterium]
METIFRQESGRIIATLIRLTGSFDLAEEAMQDAFASALAQWPSGIPVNPGAWITAVAQRKLVDHFRRERTRLEKQPELERQRQPFFQPELATLEDTSVTVADDRLRLIFTCCHPAINPAAQVALTLRTLCGLSTAEIAHAFLVPEATMAQRLVRAKGKIQAARIPYQVPPRHQLGPRLASVQAVVYLVFNEGYSAAGGASLIRSALADEAIRLGRLLCELMPGEPENLGLLALLLLQDSRRAARTTPSGDLILLDHQDRALWNRARIDEGLATLRAALGLGPPGPYQLQAAIAALHAEAPTAAGTDWAQIAALYGELLRIVPTPVVALNRAVAVAMSNGPAAGLLLMDRLEGLESFHLFHAARADLLRRLHRTEEAAAAYRTALDLAGNAVERRFLERRLSEIGSETSKPPEAK